MAVWINGVLQDDGIDSIFVDPINAADNKAALAIYRSLKLDTNGDGTGNPRVGQYYFNTTLNCRRIWDGTTWVGRALSFDAGANVSIWVRTVASGGDNAGGDGQNPATGGVPYATLRQAFQDIPQSRTWQYSIYADEPGASFELCVEDVPIGGDPVFVYGSTTWTQIGGTYTSDAVGGVVRDSFEGASHGRRLQVTGAGWTVAALKGKEIRVTSGNLNTKFGFVYDNGVDWVQFDVGYDQYSVDGFGGGAGLVDGDTFEIWEPSTTIILNDGPWSKSMLGYLQFRECAVDGSGVTGGGVTVTAGVLSLYHCYAYGTNWYGTPAGSLSATKSYIAGDFHQSNDGGNVMLYGYDGITVVTGSVMRGDGYGPLSTIFRNRVVLTKATAWSFPVNGQVICWDNQGASSGTWLRLYNHGGIALLSSRDFAGGLLARFPQTTGNVTSTRFIDIPSTVVNECSKIRIEFPLGVNVQTPTTANRCRVGSSNDTYAAPYREIEIIGTGLYKRILDSRFKAWTGSAGVTAANGMKSYDFDKDADENMIAMCSLGDKFTPGKQILADVMFDTGADIVAGHQAIVDYQCALFPRAVATNVASPPTNRYPTGASATVFAKGAVASRIQYKDLELTDSGGQINSRTPARDDQLSLSVTRDADNVSDNLDNDLRIYLDTVRLYQMV